MPEKIPLLQSICHSPSPVFFSALLNKGFALKLRQWCHLIDGTAVFIITDSTVSNLWYDRFIQCLPTNCLIHKIIVSPGEKSKSLETVATVWDVFHQANANRNSIVINLGGGVMSDLGGYAASTYMRGVQLVNVPTTLLAMTDASLGGKNALNFKGVKNQLGTFYQPKFTWIVREFLTTLPQSEFYSGLAEVFKQGLLESRQSYKALLKLGNASFNLNNGIIKSAAKFKMRIVRSDTSDKGKRLMLNFGHTIGHALESLMAANGSPVSHGQAVAWGMMVSLNLSVIKCGLAPSIRDEAFKWLHNIYGSFPVVDTDQIFELASHDKKNRSSAIRMVLLKEAGIIQMLDVPAEEIRKAMSICNS